MKQQHQAIDLQIDHPDVDDLRKDYQAKSLKAHILSLIHRWPYELLKTQAKNKNVMELGCNKGFGTIIYADYANSVKAVDTSSAAIENAKAYNARENIEYICLNSWTLPFEDNSFDLSVLFQVIEHIALDKRDIFLKEIKRVTRKEGQVIISTPNRNIRLLPFQKPWNQFHTKEYSAIELHQLLSRYFAEVYVEGLFGVEGLNEIERKRVKQKPFKVYLKDPLRKYVISPFLGWVPGIQKAVIDEALPDKTKRKATKSSVADESMDATMSINYPYTTSDLEYRNYDLEKALDLRATVSRVK